MQLRGLLFLGLLASAEGSRVVRRQDHDNAHVRRQATASSVDDTSAVDTAVVSSADPVSSTVVEVVTATSTSAVEVITSSSVVEDPITSSSVVDDTTTSSSAAADDTTVTRTVTVTDADADTITKKTTVQKTSTTTVLVTSTAFKTETETSTGATATSTVYETSTKWANKRRALDLAPRTVDNEGFVMVDAQPTAVPELPNGDEWELKDLLRRGHIMRRDTITNTVTVTVGGSDGKTVTSVVTQTVVSSTSSVTKITKTVTETEAVGASVTITTTSTLTVTSTMVTTGVVATSTATESSSSDSSSDSSNSGSSSSSSGLSTGAKAGIGAGAGVVALAALGIILWCCLKKRNKPSKSEIDDMFGSSEVPVGGTRLNSASPMTQANHGVESGLAPNRVPTKASEGYRGTAIGDGRTGYAKPNTFGAAYNAVSPETTYSRTATTSPGGEDRLPEHPSAVEMHSPANTAELGTDNIGAAKWHQDNAAEIDGSQVTSPRGSEPAEHVYEMPAQPYR
ncbi:hypothetical protein G7Z17_g5737 [Cylindrodendrum hubeiense]|uniref:Uncharacterized protein n=1 Tax=Cylindrodendrum hubeiense TaxID=595255 RepID=A0A9P5HB90_9HYPO|nr:hypothetical protein G7Z17_g5737 [Cylindrodendrum hubeiense]